LWEDYPVDCRRNFFLERHDGSTPNYQYQSLFLDLLRIQTTRSFEPEVLKTPWCKAAEMLAESGFVEKASELYDLAEEWNGWRN
jgi:ATP/maltotriose-dependent transcriptional regulator MalT